MGVCSSYKRDRKNNDNCITHKNSDLDQFKISSSFFINRTDCNPLDKYEVVELLGEGSYGKVFLVRHRVTGSLRAMKEINKSSLKNSEEENDVSNEITILKKLDYPNIVKIFEFFLTNDK